MKINEIACPVAHCQAFRTSNNLAVICGREPCGPNGELRWHLSISHAKRYPAWDEIAELRYRLIPDEVMVAMFLPPKEQYINVHRYCFHLYEVEPQDVPLVTL